MMEEQLENFYKLGIALEADPANADLNEISCVLVDGKELTAWQQDILNLAYEVATNGTP